MKMLTIIPLLAVTALSFGQDKARFGGPSYAADPALTVTASLVKAGGGENFSIATALTSMVGADTVKAEIGSLTKRYGEKRVNQFVAIFDFAVKDALKIATKAGVALPEANLEGKELATTLVKAGMDKDGTFWTCFLLDKAVSHNIHVAVMADIDQKFGAAADEDYHRISNQAHYDLGKALGVEGIKRAALH